MYQNKYNHPHADNEKVFKQYFFAQDKVTGYGSICYTASQKGLWQLLLMGKDMLISNIIYKEPSHIPVPYINTNDKNI